MLKSAVNLDRQIQDFNDCNEKKVKTDDKEASEDDSESSQVTTKDSKPKILDEELKNQKCGPDLKKKNLSTRSDVISKTIIRSIKKHYIDKFKDQTGFFRVKNKKERKSKYLRLIREFVNSEFYSKSTNGFFNLGEQEMIVLYMATILKPEYMTYSAVPYEIIKFKKTYEL